MSELSDDEVEAGVTHLGKVVASVGVTVAQACEGLSACGRAMLGQRRIIEEDEPSFGLLL